ILNSPEAKKLDANGLFEKIAFRDIQDACDIFKPVYTETNRRDGYVSLEVSPFLGYDTKATIAEAHRLWKGVNRPNVMIKIPGTPTRNTRSFLAEHAGKLWHRRVRKRSGCCGPARARRIPSSATCSTSKS